MRRLVHVFIVAAFLVIVAAPGVATLAGGVGSDQVAENRQMAPFPELALKWSAVRGFLPGLDEWFADHYAFRKQLVRTYGISRYIWLHTSPSPSVTIGPDGWLFFSDDGGLQDFTNEAPFTDAQLQDWRDTIVRAKKWCAARGIGYAFTIFPDKGSIYPELFPQTARRVNTQSRTDQILTAISDTGAGIDVRPALREGKTHDRLFQKTDTHWNSRGAYLGYRVVIDALRLQVPSIPPPKPLSDFDFVTRRIRGMDLAGMMGLTRVLGEEDLRLVPKDGRHYVVVEPKGNIVEAGEGRIVTEIPGSTLPKAYVFRDSFTSAMAPFFSEHFSRVVYRWRNDFDYHEIEAEHPDVVLQEIVSRHLQWYEPSPELVPSP